MSSHPSQSPNIISFYYLVNPLPLLMFFINMFMFPALILVQKHAKTNEAFSIQAILEKGCWLRSKAQRFEDIS